MAARAFGAVASTKTSVPLITQASSEQSICFAVPAESAASVLSALQAVFASEIEDEDIDRVWMTEDVSIITVVGVGMSHTGRGGSGIFKTWRQQGKCFGHRTGIIGSIHQHGRCSSGYGTCGEIIT